MEGLFPQGTGISRVRATVNLIKKNKGNIEMSKLAEESDEDIDDLLPIIEACKMLGFVVVSDSKLRLTERGSRLTFSNFSKLIREGLEEAEPFKSAIKILDQKEISTRELFSTLRGKRIMYHGDEGINDLLLRKVFIRWGVRSELLSYNTEKDTWAIRKEE